MPSQVLHHSRTARSGHRGTIGRSGIQVQLQSWAVAVSPTVCCHVCRYSWRNEKMSSHPNVFKFSRIQSPEICEKILCEMSQSNSLHVDSVTYLSLILQINKCFYSIRKNCMGSVQLLMPFYTCQTSDNTTLNSKETDSRHLDDIKSVRILSLNDI